MDSYLTKLLYKLGKWYPLVMVMIMQGINSLLFLLLTAMPAQQNAAFTTIQGKNLLFFGIIGIIIKNTLVHYFIYRNSWAILNRLSLLGSPNFFMISIDLEKQAWKQARSLESTYHKYEIYGLIVLIVIPISLIGYYVLSLTIEQIVHLVLAATASVLVVFLFDMMESAFLFAPVLQVLVPNHFEDQIINTKGSSIRRKLTSTIVGLLVINLLLTLPAIFLQIDKIIDNPDQASQIASQSIWVIIRAGMGAVVIGALLSVNLVIFFNKPISRLFDFFKKVERGDLSAKIDIFSTDEFGDINIHLNHMINNLKRMTESLEEQVNNRTNQLQRAKLKLQHIALHDSLTNLPNRILFLDRLQQMMVKAKRHKHCPYVVIFIDLDRFKVINDSLGHNVGDLLLIEFAQRLTSCVRAEDTVARLGGDEFVILLDEVSSLAGYQQVVERIYEVIKPPAILDNHETLITISMGIVEGNLRYEKPEDLIRDADIAMYKAKKNGHGGYELFDPELLNITLARLDLESNLRKALENNEFIIYYQPILNLETQKTVGFEALVRWNHPTDGIILPGEFLPIVEEIGLIVPLGYWVLDEACHQIKIWQQQYPSEPPMTISINFSTYQCSEKDLVDRIEKTLNKYGLDPNSLKLELTESLFLNRANSIGEILQKIRNLGVQVHIDNFGTSFFSLGDLQFLPIDTVKIDRGLINKLDSNVESKIVQAILYLAKNIGIKVIAEGVETNKQFAKLRSLNCEFVQGFFLAKPMDRDSINDLLKKQFS